jgi:hypothetical protein
MMKQNGPMMMMLIPDQVMKALKGSDDEPSAEGEPVEEGGEMEDEGEEEMGKKRCPMCGRC